MDEAKRDRRGRKRDVMRDLEEINHAIQRKETLEFIEEMNKDLKEHWEKFTIAQENVMKHVKEEEEVEEEHWMEETRKSYMDVRRLICQVRSDTRGNKKTDKVNDDKRLQLKKMEPPKFYGDVKNYTRFREDFKKFVMPVMHPDQIAFALRQSLGPAPLAVVNPAEDDVEKIWAKLDEKYGQRSKLVDVVVGEIVSHKVIHEKDKLQLVKFIDMVEAGYRNLERMNLENEMGNCRVVGEIERKLPTGLFDRWVRHIHERKIDQDDRMKELLRYLESERTSIEYSLESLRSASQQERDRSHQVKTVLATEVRPASSSCLVHRGARHSTEECHSYRERGIDERIKLIKEMKACFRCLKIGHQVQRCREGVCNQDGCQRKHHPSIHFFGRTQKTPIVGNSAVVRNGDGGVLLMAVVMRSNNNKQINGVFDGGATASMVTHEAARKLRAKGHRVQVELTKVGAESSIIDTILYNIELVDLNGKPAHIKAYGMEAITRDLCVQDVNHLAKIMGVNPEEIRRPVGKVELMIGMNYADLQPEKIKSKGHLILGRSRFGLCVGGWYAGIKAEDHVDVNLVEISRTSRQFLELESIGVSCQPKCGGCKCGKCPLGAKNYTLCEERELNLIEEGLTYKDKRWCAKYPWIRNPMELPDNRAVVEAKLNALERKLSRDPESAEAYRNQMKDMLERNVSREIGEKELKTYSGPYHYIAHHGVYKPGSDSTPLRIVFNSSASYKGHVLNEYWAKGPDLNNNLMGVLLRFREESTALVGDVRKMYHSVSIPLVDQHCHRFLWRDLQYEENPKTYCVTAVNFGDKPAATMAICALHKTAELSQDQYPEAVTTLKENVYMDDVLDSLESVEASMKRASEIDEILEKGSFRIKKWVVSRPDSAESSMKVLGLEWDPRTDKFRVPCDVKQVELDSVLTKRECLSRMNSVFDPLGLLSPVTVRAKMLLRELWGKELGWDTSLEEIDKKGWASLFKDIEACSKITIPRCIKAVSNDCERPILVMFSDASQRAMGTVAYAAHPLRDGGYKSSLVAAKSRVAPVKISSIVRLELSAALLSARLAKTILEETRVNFQRVVYVVDSEIVRAMVQKQSYGFKTFVATRIGEIQQISDPADWFWVAGERNIADIISRGASPKDLSEQSAWQKGPEFLSYPFENWPISQSCPNAEIPERIGVVMLADVHELNKSPIDVQRFSSFGILLRVTAIVRKIFKRKSFRSVALVITADDIGESEMYWVKEIQRPMLLQMKTNRNEYIKKYGRLGPHLREDGVIVVGDRIREHVHFSYNQEMVPVLLANHPVSKLYVERVHKEGHHGIATTVSKVRSKYWITKLRRLATGVRHRCVRCRKFEGKLLEQKMADLPVKRLKPSPPWSCVSCDMFGPMVIRGEVQKRTRGKAYGVIFSCLVTRAIHLDLSTDYSTKSFLKVFRRFVASRGYPSTVFSDRGTQLVAASEEIKRSGVGRNVTWSFSTPDAPWQNGITEALIRGVKKSLFHAIGEQVLTYEGLQTVLYEVADLMNSRPIGKHPTNPADGSYLCPNDLLLGRSSKEAPKGRWCDAVGFGNRLKFMDSLKDAFWEKWTRDYFPSLLVRKKWHTEKRNLEVDDVVLIQEENVKRGQWKIGRITDVYPDQHGIVRNVMLRTITEGGLVSFVRRAVQRLVLLIAQEEQ